MQPSAPIISLQSCASHATVSRCLGSNLFLCDARELNLDSSLVQLRNLCIATAAGTPIVSDLDVQLAWGQRLVIEGPSGCGKSTFVKALCGLWPCSMTRERWPLAPQVFLLKLSTASSETRGSNLTHHHETLSSGPRLSGAVSGLHHLHLCCGECTGMLVAVPELRASFDCACQNIGLITQLLCNKLCTGGGDTSSTSPSPGLNPARADYIP